MYKAVIFDLGKVLVNFSSTTMYKNVARVLGTKVDDVHANLAKANLQNKYETGLISTSEIIETLRATATSNFEDSDLRLAFCDIFTEMSGMSEILTSLKDKGLKLAILSNTNELHIEWIWEKFEFLKIFDYTICSHTEHSMKPAPQIYQAALKALGCETHECIFVDDLPENIQGAEKMGIKSILFRNPDSLLSDLKKLKVR